MSKNIKRALLFTLGIVVLILLIATFQVYEQIGNRYTNEVSKSKFESLPYYNAAINEFVSPERLISEKEKTTGGDPGFLRFFKESPNAPNSILPSVILQKNDFSKIPSNFAVYWFGHSSTLLELDGQRILIDPVFDNAGPLPGIAQRFGNAPVKRNDLPEIDILVITHDHYDHLEANTIKHFASQNVHFVVPLGVGARLLGWGVSKDKLTELGWHQRYKQKNVQITACPSVHYSGRSNKDKNKTLWASYVIQGAKKKIFWSGDTGYGKQFKQIGSMYGPFEVAFIEIDAWNKGWPNTHLFPEQVIEVVNDVHADYLFPIHLATFDLALHPWKESIKMVSRLAERSKIKMITPIMGQKVIPGLTKTEKWWEAVN